jgi:hypothetical protein
VGEFREPGPASVPRRSDRSEREPALVAPARSRDDTRWPDFFIVGAQSSGTTSLYSYLKRHPQVFLPAFKEPHYFSQIATPPGVRYVRIHIANRAAYLDLFADADASQMMGDASTSYLWEPHAAERIYAVNPAAKIIIMMRDPIQRAHSQYLKDVREGIQRLPFLEALQTDFRGADKRYGFSLLYIEHGLYFQQVKRYLELFGPDQVRVFSFDLLKDLADRRTLVCEIADLLQIDPAVAARLDISRVENQFRVARFNWVPRLAGSRLFRTLGQGLIRPRFGSMYRMKQMVFEPWLLKRAPRPPIDLEAKSWLVSLYRDDVKALEELLRTQLPGLRSSW